jgi:hypothetical protein
MKKSSDDVDCQGQRALTACLRPGTSTVNDFTKGVKARLESRSAIYAIMFLLLIIGQQLYKAHKAEQQGQAVPNSVIEQTAD